MFFVEHPDQHNNNNGSTNSMKPGVGLSVFLSRELKECLRNLFENSHFLFQCFPYHYFGGDALLFNLQENYQSYLFPMYCLTVRCVNMILL